MYGEARVFLFSFYIFSKTLHVPLLAHLANRKLNTFPIYIWLWIFENVSERNKENFRFIYE